MERRRFIKSLSIAGAAVNFPATFSISSVPNKKLGVMIDLIRLSGFSETDFESSHIFQDYELAKQALASGEIDHLVSSPFYLIKDHPEFSLFGHFPTDLPHETKSGWVADHYSFVQDHYLKSGFKSELVGLTSSQMIRMTNLQSAEFYQSQKDGAQIRIAANGQRALWYGHVGYQAVRGPLVDKIRFQIEMMHRNRLNITEASSPFLYVSAIQQNEQEKFVALDYYQSQHLILDTHSRRGLPLEIISRSDSNLSGSQNLKIQLLSFLAYEQTAQNQSLKSILTLFNHQTYDGLPGPILTKLEQCKRNYLEVLAAHNEVSRVLVKAYKKLTV